MTGSTAASIMRPPTKNIIENRETVDIFNRLQVPRVNIFIYFLWYLVVIFSTIAIILVTVPRFGHHIRTGSKLFSSLCVDTTTGGTSSDLDKVIARYPNLSAEVRTAILAFVDTSE